MTQNSLARFFFSINAGNRKLYLISLNKGLQRRKLITNMAKLVKASSGCDRWVFTVDYSIGFITIVIYVV